jgi:hypothetical protein
VVSVGGRQSLPAEAMEPTRGHRSAGLRLYAGRRAGPHVSEIIDSVREVPKSLVISVIPCEAAMLKLRGMTHSVISVNPL